MQWWGSSYRAVENIVTSLLLLLSNLLSGAVECSDCASVEGWVSWMWHWTVWWWGSSDAGALGGAECPFIAVAPRSVLARSGGT